MTFDVRQFRRIERAGFNRIGERYRIEAGRRRPLLDALLDLAAPSGGERVLDLAAGPGLLAAAARVRAPDAFVVASDLAEGQLACHRAVPGVAADAQHLPFADGSFDLVLCGLGLMFFPDEAAALAEMRRVIRPGGRLALSVWGPAAEAPLVACAMTCLRRVLPPPKVERPSVFRCGEGDWLERRLAGADFRGIRLEDFALVTRFDSATDYWQAFLDLAGGVAESLARLPAAVRERFPDEVARELAPFAHGGPGDGGYRLTSRLRLAVAYR